MAHTLPTVDDDTPGVLINDSPPVNMQPAILPIKANPLLDTTIPNPTMAIFNAVADAVSAPGPWLLYLELLENYYTYFNGA